MIGRPDKIHHTTLALLRCAGGSIRWFAKTAEERKGLAVKPGALCRRLCVMAFAALHIVRVCLRREQACVRVSCSWRIMPRGGARRQCPQRQSVGQLPRRDRLHSYRLLSPGMLCAACWTACWTAVLFCSCNPLSLHPEGERRSPIGNPCPPGHRPQQRISAALS